MMDLRIVVRLVPVLTATMSMVAPAAATTLVRQGLDRLTTENEAVVQAKILETHSYWNDDHTFILTDVRARASRVFKGPDAESVTLTLMGGTVGEVTTLIVGGASLVPGSEYVLFLAHADLPGASGRLTVREHAQAVFVLENGRAFSEAIGEPLVPDANGDTAVPGGEDGLAVDELIRQILQHSHH